METSYNNEFSPKNFKEILAQKELMENELKEINSTLNKPKEKCVIKHMMYLEIIDKIEFRDLLLEVRYKNENSFTHAVYSYKDIKYPLTNIAKYEIKPTPPTFNQDSFKYQALYQGKTDNKIKISFREFKDNMARPAFTQDIEYELDSKGTTTIGFKGLRIEVLKATNYDITYKVIKDYN